MSRRIHIALVLACLAGPLSGSTAHASLATDLQAELEQAGVPQASVTILQPAAATAEDVAAFLQNPEMVPSSITNENMISPDPTNPLPLMRVRFGVASPTPFPGLLTSPGIGTTHAISDAELPVWRLQTMAALKHGLASGVSLAGVAMEPLLPNRPHDGPDLYMTPPDPVDFPPDPLPEGMPMEEAESGLRQGLPAWAQRAAVRVDSWVGGERRAVIELSMSVPELSQLPVATLVGNTLASQVDLNRSGANIGSVVVRIESTGPVTTAAPFTELGGLPLFTYAGDAGWGQSFAWVSPYARPWIDTPVAGIRRGDPASEVDETLLQTQTEIEESNAGP